MDGVVVEIQHWIDSLPTGVAALEIVHVERRGTISLSIEPIENPAASAVRLEIHPTFFDVTAGMHFHETGIPRSSVSPTEYCQAIALGLLVEVELLHRGRLVGWKAELKLPDRRVLVEEPGGGRGGGMFDWIRGLAWKKRPLLYVPYFDLLPLKSRNGPSVVIKPPILGVEQGALHVSAFRSVDDTLGLEVNDVSNDGLVTLYDAAGRLLQAITGEGQHWATVATERDPTRQSQLRGALISYLSRLELSGVQLESLALADLAALVLRSQGM